MLLTARFSKDWTTLDTVLTGSVAEVVSVSCSSSRLIRL